MWRRVGVVFGLAAVMLVSATLVVTPSGDGAVTGPDFDLQYVTRKKALQPKEKGVSLKAPCPRGTQVIGGGATVTGFPGVPPTILKATVPFDGPDGGRVPDDGWLAVASNFSSVKQRMRAYAICATGALLSYHSTTVDVAPDATVAADVGCFSNGEATAGGVQVKSIRSTSFIGSTHPHDDGDGDTVPSDGWKAVVQNTSITKADRVVVWAVCEATTPSVYTYVTAASSLIAPGAAQATAWCPAMQEPTGGGYRTQTGVPVVVGETFPADDTPGEPPEGWAGAAMNHSGVAQNIDTTVVCM